MPDNDYTEMRAWLEGVGAQCAGTIGRRAGGFSEADIAADFEVWVYGGYTFILARLHGTGGVTLFSRVGVKDSTGGDERLHLRVMFRQEDIRREKLKHTTKSTDACALAEQDGNVVHYCDVGRGHMAEHYCDCGFMWSQVEGDNALLTHPADAKKKPERVRGFQI